ncbi:MAG: hypothetical protein ACWA5A_11400 [Marinibacterium sp.]
MQIILHTGAHFTEEDRLVKCLLRNVEAFSKRGISVPGPGRYRTLLKDTLQAMRDTRLDTQARDILMDAILDDDQSKRMILSNAHFFGAPRAALRDGILYPNGPEKVRQFRTLFPHDDIHVFMAIRNPATLLPAIYSQSPRNDLLDFLQGVDPRHIRWSETLTAMRVTSPSIPITIWCYEDMPLIWADIVRAMAGLPADEKITGGFDLLSDIISPEGMRRFRAYLKEHPNMTPEQKHRVIAAFLDKYALEEAITEELEMPGWSLPLIDEMTEIYDDDFDTIREIPGVSVIAP